jgi:O-antigen/teichoic acid export membrane protein
MPHRMFASAIRHVTRNFSADLRRSIRNAVYSSADHLLMPVLMILATPVLLAHLREEQYGIWMLVNSVTGLGGMLSLGLTDATVKFVSRYRAREDTSRVVKVIRSTLTMYLILGAVAGIVIFLLSDLLAATVFNVSAEYMDTAVLAVRIAGVAIWVRFIHSVFQSGLYGFERYDLAARVGILVNAITTIVNVCLALTGFGLEVILVATVSILGMGAIAMAVVLKRTFLPELVFTPAIDGQILKEVMGYGVFRWIQSAIAAVGKNIDNFLIAAFVGPVAVTYYAISKMLAIQVHALLAKAFSFLFPFSGVLFEKDDKERLRTVYDKATFTVIILASGVLLPLYIFGRNILQVWLGADFAEEAAPILQVLCIRYAFLPIGIVNYHYLLGTGLVRAQTVIHACMTAITLVGMAILVPRHGAMGAAIAMLLNLPVMFITRVYVRKKLFGRLDIGGSLSYFIPILIPFMCATGLILWTELPSLSILTLLMALCLVSASTVCAVFLIARACQKLGWMPS